MIERDLQNLGLSQREAKVYVALLALGSTTVGPISNKTTISSPKIYPTLQKLQEKGLVSHIIVSKTKYFQALSPNNLLRTIKEKEALFTELVPQLEALQFLQNTIPTAEIFQGFASTKTLFDDIVSKMDMDSFYYVFAFKDQYKTNNTAKYFVQNFHKILEELNVDDRLIAHTSVKNEVLEAYSGNTNVKKRFSQASFPAGLIITKNFIIIDSWEKEAVHIRINSSAIAKQYALFFESMWDTVCE